MRKIVAFVLCSMLAFSLGFTLLPQSFSLLAAWLGPVFGTSLHVLLSMIFVLFGDPLKFTTLLFLWATVGVVCGLIIRRRLGSLSLAWLVYSVMFLIIIVAALRMFEIVMDSGILQRPEDMLSILPPLPPGATLGAVLSAPVVSDVYSALQGMSFASISSPTAMIFGILGLIIPNFVKNAVILLASSLAGCEAGKLAEKHLFPKIMKKGSVPAGSNVGTSSTMIRITTRKVWKKPWSVFFSAFLASALVASSAIITVNGLGNSYYAEGIIGLVTPDGTAYVASAFVDSEMYFSNIDFSSSEFSGALVGVLISQDTSASALPPILTSPGLLGGKIPSEFPSEILQNLTRFYELVPKTVFLAVYVDVNPTVARQRADIAASKFSSAFGAPLSFLVNFTQQAQLGNVTRSFTVLVYQSMSTLSTVAGNIMNALPTQRGGLASVINSVYGNGTFTPGATRKSANGTVMAVGLFSSSMISGLLETEDHGPQDLLRLILPNSTAPTPMLGVFSYWLNRLHSSSFSQTFSINDLLNYQGPIQFSPEATMSLIGMFVPNATIENGQITNEEPIVSLITSANLTSPEFEPVQGIIQSINETTAIKITQVTPGIPITAEKLAVTFTQVFPLNLRVEKLVSTSDVDIGQRITITIKIVNNDADPAANVTLNDTLLFDYYGPWALQLTEGNLTQSWAIIPGNSTVTHNYSVILKKEGIYSLPTADLIYTYVNQRFTAKSNAQFVSVRSPSLPSLLIEGIPAAWGILERSINRVPGLQGSGSLVLTSATAGIIAPLAFLEYRNVTRWLKARKQSQ